MFVQPRLPPSSKPNRNGYHDCPKCLGILLVSDGAKMSKSLRNYPDVTRVFNRDGADAMRWFLLSAPVMRGGNLVVTDKAVRDAA